MEKISVDKLLTLDITGKIICFPTDTVYGVGACINDFEAIKKIYHMKKRNYNKPLAILTPTKDIKQFINNFDDVAQTYIDNYWPGPLTLIFKKNNLINDIVTRGMSTVAFRMPDSKVALKILNKFGLMATTSVNIAGEKELNSISAIEEKFSDYLDYLIIDEEQVLKKPSKVIDCSGPIIKIIRN